MRGSPCCATGGGRTQGCRQRSRHHTTKHEPCLQRLDRAGAPRLGKGCGKGSVTAGGSAPSTGPGALRCGPQRCPRQGHHKGRGAPFPPRRHWLPRYRRDGTMGGASPPRHVRPQARREGGQGSDLGHCSPGSRRGFGTHPQGSLAAARAPLGRYAASPGRAAGAGPGPPQAAAASRCPLWRPLADARRPVRRGRCGVRRTPGQCGDSLAEHGHTGRCRHQARHIPAPNRMAQPEEGRQALVPESSARRCLSLQDAHGFSHSHPAAAVPQHPPAAHGFPAPPPAAAASRRLL